MSVIMRALPGRAGLPKPIRGISARWLDDVVPPALATAQREWELVRLAWRLRKAGVDLSAGSPAWHRLGRVKTVDREILTHDKSPLERYLAGLRDWDDRPLPPPRQPCYSAEATLANPILLRAAIHKAKYFDMKMAGWREILKAREIKRLSRLRALRLQKENIVRLFSKRKKPKGRRK